MVKKKKADILEAAKKAFAYYGYDKTTLDDIGKIAGLNKASLYYYYKNKESIFIDVIKTEIEELIGHVRKKNSAIQGYKQKITAYLRELFSRTGATANINKLAMDTAYNFHPFFLELVDDLIHRHTAYIVEILRESRKNGEIVKCDEEKVASSIVTVIQSVKNKNCSFIDSNIQKVTASSSTEDEIIFTVSLILDGLSSNRPEALAHPRHNRRSR